MKGKRAHINKWFLESILVIACALLSLLPFSCSSNNENSFALKPEAPTAETTNVGSPSKKIETQIEKIDSLDLLTPIKVKEHEGSSYQTELLFPSGMILQTAPLSSLFEIFFSNFVSVINTNPFDTRVDYQKLGAMIAKKDAGLDRLFATIESKLKNLPKNHSDTIERASILINAYNYASIRLAQKGLASKGINSLRDLSDPLFPNEMFERSLLIISGQSLSLDQLAKKDIRSLFKRNPDDSHPRDFRYVFLLGGAVIDRGLVLPYAITKNNFWEAMTQAEMGLRSLPRFMNLSGNTLRLGAIYKWYQADIKKKFGSLEDYLINLSVNTTNYEKVVFKEFDWSLNQKSTYTPALDNGMGVQDPTHIDQEQQAVNPPEEPITNQPEEPIPTPEQNQNPINGLTLNTSRYCSGLNNVTITDSTKPFALCEEVYDGALNETIGTQRTTTDSRLCLFIKTRHEDQVQSFGIQGHFVENNIARGYFESVVLNGLGALNLGNQKLSTSFNQEIKTEISYSIEEKILTLSQQSLATGRKLRHFSLRCH